MPTPILPRLLYIGDVPVESSYHGSALIYRLLQGYCPEKLQILETNLAQSEEFRRLDSVKYDRIWVAPQRILNTRLNTFATNVFSKLALQNLSTISRKAEEFSPEAILTVAHGFSWLSAASFAKQRKLPLHLIVHDDWPRCLHDPHLRNWTDKKFREIYEFADTRLCVSSFMAERYESLYGVEGSVLLPCRASDSPVFDAPPRRLLKEGRSLTALFGGSINSPGYIRALSSLADSLHRVNGSLLIYSPNSEGDLRRAGLNQKNIVWRGLVTSKELIEIARDEADFLFVPMSYDSSDLVAMEVNFPSKLTDYTSAGIPLFISGPESSSAVKWATTNREVVAEVITEASISNFDEALLKLQDPDHRWKLGQAALNQSKAFSHERIVSLFLDKIKVS